jgi:hypothetical protein
MGIVCLLMGAAPLMAASRGCGASPSAYPVASSPALTSGQILARTLIGRTVLQMQVLSTLFVGQGAINARASEVEEIVQVEKVDAYGPVLTLSDDL